MANNPVAIDDLFEIYEDQPLSGNILANDFDADGDQIFVRFFDGERVLAKQSSPAETLIAGDYGTFHVRPDGQFTYELNLGIVLNDGESITETLNVKIGDQTGLTDVSRFTLTVLGKSPPPVNVAPVAVDDVFDFTVGDSFTGNLLANDIDANGDTLRLRAFDGTAVNGKGLSPAATAIAGDYGTFYVLPDGSFTYELNPGVVLAEGETLTEHASAKISDGHARDVSHLTLTIHGAPSVDPAIVNVTLGSDNGTTNLGIPGITADGSLLAFASTSTNLTPGDTATSDVFLYDRATETFTNVTEGGNGASSRPFLSADGSVLAFVSEASNLTSDDTNGSQDVFLYNVLEGGFTKVASGNLVAQSADGSAIAFYSDEALTPDDGNSTQDLYLYDVGTGAFTNLSLGTPTFGVDFSADGDRVVFGLSDSVVLYDAAAQTRTVVASDAGYGDISADGSTIVYNDGIDLDTFTNHLFLYDVATATTTDVGAGAPGLYGEWSLSADGQTLAFTSSADDLTPDDSQAVRDLTFDAFIYDVATGAFTLVTPDNDDDVSSPVLSADGSTLAFSNVSTEMEFGGSIDPRFYRYDVPSGVTIEVTAGQETASGAYPALSSDGSVMAFYYGLPLVPGDTNAAFDLHTYEML